MHVDGYGGALAFDAMGVRYLDVGEGAGKELRAFHVCGFVESPCFLLLWGARDREAGDAVKSGRAQVEF